jgi:hypothetical protein
MAVKMSGPCGPMISISLISKLLGESNKTGILILLHILMALEPICPVETLVTKENQEKPTTLYSLCKSTLAMMMEQLTKKK